MIKTDSNNDRRCKTQHKTKRRHILMIDQDFKHVHNLNVVYMLALGHG